jgi:redox-sensitive bicupin YhaK (pirin superfamily)
MIKLHKYNELGGDNHGWLDTKHHFSFAGYHDPKKMSFGELLVINDDIIAPYTGFDMHPHRDMEIITYVRTGAISHKDNRGNKGRTTAGNVQVMSAGTGIFHSEFNHEDEATTIYQIWIMPRSKGIDPVWDTAEFPTEQADGALSLLVSGDGQAPLQINQDARIYASRLSSGAELVHKIKGQAYILVSDGNFEIGGVKSEKGDGLAISNESKVDIKATSDGEILIIEVPGITKAR